MNSVWEQSSNKSEDTRSSKSILPDSKSESFQLSVSEEALSSLRANRLSSLDRGFQVLSVAAIHRCVILCAGIADESVRRFRAGAAVPPHWSNCHSRGKGED